MIAADPILDFLSICVWTAMLVNEQPVSVVLIADSSSGKSEMLKKLRCPITIFTTDMTTRDLSNIMADKDKRIILLSDMQAIFSHKSTVVGTTTQALRNLLQEGIYTDPFSGQAIERRFGLITAIPPTEFKSSKVDKMFHSGGLDTRFLTFEYAYKTQTIAKIHDSIEEGTHVKEKPLSNLPEDGQSLLIQMQPEIAHKCRGLAAALKPDPIGTRIHLHIRRLVMASAARAKRAQTTIEDFELIEHYSDYLNPNEDKVML